MTGRRGVSMCHPDTAIEIREWTSVWRCMSERISVQCIVCYRRGRFRGDRQDRHRQRTDRQTDRQSDRQTDRQTDRVTDRQTDRQTDRVTDRQTESGDRQSDRS
ncbi:glycosyltransferase-like 9 [Homarus americanus]|uniref:Glycosyltransferase-like 9 n=1 Tax=Homarus americanus TaxID=6706 RepID=A0A8J5TKC5_HOMAM|nr:glycosyltransferase-like 9 [Homarus americanus]